MVAAVAFPFPLAPLAKLSGIGYILFSFKEMAR
jgi:hypothetical protein